MKYPIDAVEACEALSHPLPFPGMDVPPMATRRPIWPAPDHGPASPNAKKEIEELGARIDEWIAAQHAARQAQQCTDDHITARLYQSDGGRKVDTVHPGPIEMFESAAEDAPKAAQADHTKRQNRLIFAAVVLALISAAVVIHDMATNGKTTFYPF